MRFNTTRRSDTRGSLMPAIIVFMLTSMVCAVITSLLMKALPVDNKDIIVYMVGQLSGVWSASVYYFISNTSGSKAKDQLLADSIPIKREKSDEQTSVGQ